MSIIRRDQFTGSNNIAKPERLPEGAVVDAVNMDFTVGGKAELRTGFVKVQDGSDIRALFDMNGALVVVDGAEILKVVGDESVTLATISKGPVAAVPHNGKLYLNTLIESIVIDDSVMPWGIKEPAFDVSLVSGSASPGIYKVGVTRIVDGRESGIWPAVVSVSAGQAISVTCAGGVDLILYSSVANGQTLYSQGMAASYNTISHPVDGTHRAETENLTTLPFCSILESHEGVIVGANGRFVYFTKPMHPHLHDEETGYLQFPSDITVIASVGSGLYVCADNTYFISRLGGADMEQRVVAEFGAVSGTKVRLPDGSAAWFGIYGQVIAKGDGALELSNMASYSPYNSELGSAGFLEHNGNQMIVTTMRGEQSGSRLKSTDHWDIEVI